jgi:hypothetical protein
MVLRDKVTLLLAALVVGGPVACDDVLHSGALPSLEHFEGRLDFSAHGSFAKGAAEAVPVAVFVKDDKLRFDPPAAGTSGGGSFLIDSPTKRFFVVNPAEKQAIQFDLSVAKPKEGADAPVVTKTGRKIKVAGFSCEEWEVTETEQRKESVCVADKPASFFDIPVTGGMLGSRAWLRQVLDGHHVPLRLVAFDKAGAETGRIELVSITRAPQDAALFSVGDGVHIVDIGALLQQGGGAPHAGGFDGHDTTKIPARPAHS